jgi:hypothetical protein
MRRRKSYVVNIKKLNKANGIDPFQAFYLPRRQKWNRYKPQSRHRDEDERDSPNRHHDYDAPRIRYFRDQFKAGRWVEPLSLDIDFWSTDPCIMLNNGYHRLAGAILAGKKTIRVRIYGENLSGELTDRQKKALKTIQ